MTGQVTLEGAEDPKQVATSTRGTRRRHTRRGNHEGGISKRRDGRWEGKVSLPDGRRKTVYGRTRADVAAKVVKIQGDLQRGLPVVSEKETVGEFLAAWLETARPTVRPTTYTRYKELVNHATPHLGKKKLARLTVGDLQALYAAKLAEGCSPTSVRHLHSVLHLALGRAVRWGLVGVNVASSADAPRRAHTEFHALTSEQARTFLEAARGDRYEGLYTLALVSGMRLGELLALKWQAVDLEAGRLQVLATLQPKGVFGEPKTQKGKRQIVLPPLAVDALRKHRARQNEERLAMGPDWEDQGLVFTNAVGHPVDANNLRKRHFEKLLERAELPRVRFHDLRHSTASLLLSQGVHPKIVQELLGHSQISVTMDTYSHVMPVLQRDAMTSFGALLQGTI